MSCKLVSEITGSDHPKRMTETVIELIEAKLQQQWSPEQIAGVLRIHDRPISHQTIYQHIEAVFPIESILKTVLKW